jgi:pimeloyl-ACP methyl ester carboxylesterase
MAGRQEIGGDWKLPDTFDFKDEQVRFGTLGEGSPLVLLHGTPFSSVVWRRIAPWLANHRRVFYFDLLGYGRSEKHDGHDVSLGIQNEVLTALLDRWELDRPDIAHDFGGTMALRVHSLNGRDYRSPTLIDPVAIEPYGSSSVQAAKGNPDVFTALPPLSIRLSFARISATRCFTRFMRTRCGSTWSLGSARRRRSGGILSPDCPEERRLHRRDREPIWRNSLPVTILWGSTTSGFFLPAAKSSRGAYPTPAFESLQKPNISCRRRRRRQSWRRS